MGSANAALVSVDWKTKGDGLALVDQQSGIEWMTLDGFKEFSSTNGHGYKLIDYVNNTNNMLQGWRLPTFDEVAQLFSNNLYYEKAKNNASGILNGSRRWDTGYDAKFSGVVNYLGYTHTGPDYKYTNVTYINKYGNLSQAYFWDSNTSQNQSGGQYRYAYTQDNLENYSASGMLLFLVSDGGSTLSSIEDPTININNENAPINAVPLTSTGIILSSLLGFLGIRRKVKNRI